MRRPPRLGGKRRFLLSVGALFILLGASYLTTSNSAPQASVAFAVDPVPLWCYGLVFIGAGLVGIVSAFHRGGGHPIGFVTLQFVCTSWGAAYLGSQLIDGYPRGFVLAGLFLGLSSAITSVAGLVEPPRQP